MPSPSLSVCTACRKLVLLAWLVAFPFAWSVVGQEGEEVEPAVEGEHGEEEEYEVEPAYAVLYPWFILAMGVLSYYTISRYAPWMPYTAVMFGLGTIIGVATRTNSHTPNQLNISIEYFWMEIDSEVLLLTFLPGLIFSDSTSLNTHLFEKAFGQILLMAFPLVLAGTALSALVAYYIFPYGWSFNLAMTFGSILSATDPAGECVCVCLEPFFSPFTSFVRVLQPKKAHKLSQHMF
jgi:Sodium/hydrogen exchanger family